MDLAEVFGYDNIEARPSDDPLATLSKAFTAKQRVRIRCGRRHTDVDDRGKRVTADMMLDYFEHPLHAGKWFRRDSRGARFDLVLHRAGELYHLHRAFVDASGTVTSPFDLTYSAMLCHECFDSNRIGQAPPLQ